MIISSNFVIEKRCPRAWGLAAFASAFVLVVGSSLLPAGKTIAQQIAPPTTPRPASTVLSKQVSLERSTSKPAMAGILAPPPPTPASDPLINTNVVVNGNDLAKPEPEPAPMQFEGVIVDKATGLPVADAQVVVSMFPYNPMGCATSTPQVRPTLAQSQTKTDKHGKYAFSIPAKFGQLQSWNNGLMRIDVWHATDYIPREDVTVPFIQVLQDRVYGKPAFFERFELVPAPLWTWLASCSTSRQASPSKAPR